MLRCDPDYSEKTNTWSSNAGGNIPALTRHEMMLASMLVSGAITDSGARRFVVSHLCEVASTTLDTGLRAQLALAGGLNLKNVDVFLGAVDDTYISEELVDAATVVTGIAASAQRRGDFESSDLLMGCLGWYPYDPEELEFMNDQRPQDAVKIQVEPQFLLAAA